MTSEISRNLSTNKTSDQDLEELFKLIPRVRYKQRIRTTLLDYSTEKGRIIPYIWINKTREDCINTDVETQCEDIKTFAESKNWPMAKIIIDKGPKQKKLYKMLSLLWVKEVVVCPNITRLCNSNDHFTDILRKIGEAGCVLQLLDQKYDSSTRPMWHKYIDLSNIFFFNLEEQKKRITEENIYNEEKETNIRNDNDINDENKDEKIKSLQEENLSLQKKYDKLQEELNELKRKVT